MGRDGESHGACPLRTRISFLWTAHFVNRVSARFGLQNTHRTFSETVGFQFRSKCVQIVVAHTEDLLIRSVSQNIMRKHAEIYVLKWFPMRAESALRWSDLLTSVATTTASAVFKLGWKERSCCCICIPLKYKLKSTKLFKFCSKFLNKTKKKPTGTDPCNCTSRTPHHVETPVNWPVICSVHTCHQN